jgi:hypothetical protein
VSVRPFLALTALLCLVSLSFSRVINPSKFGQRGDSDTRRFQLALRALQDGDTLIISRRYKLSGSSFHYYSRYGFAVLLKTNRLTITGGGTIEFLGYTATVVIRGDGLRIRNVSFIGALIESESATILAIENSKDVVLNNVHIFRGYTGLKLSNVDGFVLNNVAIKNSFYRGLEFTRCSRNGKVNRQQIIGATSMALASGSGAGIGNCKARNVQFNSLRIVGKRNSDSRVVNWTKTGIIISEFFNVTFRDLRISYTQWAGVVVDFDFNQDILFDNVRLLSTNRGAPDPTRVSSRYAAIVLTLPNVVDYRHRTFRISFQSVTVTSPGRDTRVLGLLRLGREGSFSPYIFNNITFANFKLTGSFSRPYVLIPDQLEDDYRPEDFFKRFSFSCWKKNGQLMRDLYSDSGLTVKSEAC